MKIEVCYASTSKQALLEVDVIEGITVHKALDQSGLLELFPEIDLNTAKVGIFSQAASLDQKVIAGDRIEVYRPLLCDQSKKGESEQRVHPEGNAVSSRQ